NSARRGVRWLSESTVTIIVVSRLRAISIVIVTAKATIESVVQRRSKMAHTPGFTAETSLCEQTQHYRARSANADGRRGVILAQFLGRGIGCYRACLAQCSPADPYCEDNCHCICYGRPCPRPGCNCWLM